MTQNKVHDEQIILTKLRQEKFKQQESSTFMNKRNDFFVNCYGNKFGDVYHIWMTEYQITMKKMQIKFLRFFYFNDDF